MKGRPEQERIRFEKLAALRSAGFAYPNELNITGSSLDVLNSEITEASEAKRFSLAGRVVQLRLMGKAAVAHILDGKGKVQVYLRKDDIGEAAYEQVKHLDLGDIINVSGFAFVTKTGEKTLHVESFTLLVKGLIPLPEKWHNACR